MAELNVQFVRPDRALFQGPVASLVLVTYAGELGVYPGHAAEIVALGNGVVRMKKLPQDGGGEEDVVVSGGYAVVPLAKTEAIDAREACDEGDHRRAYYDNKANWCNLLLKQTIKD